MPVKVKQLRTLWTLPQTGSTSMAHKPFVDLFDAVRDLSPTSVIREGDAMFFDGGTDVDPRLYGEEPHIMTGKPDTTRDERERHAFKRAQAAGASCLGVCRGAQFLTVMSGGKLVQHVTGHGHGHTIQLDDGVIILTESSHHQVMWPFEINHVMIGWADNKYSKHEISDEYGKEFVGGQYPEIIYCKDTRSLCIQGHTEWVHEDAPFAKTTRNLVREFIIGGK